MTHLPSRPAVDSLTSVRICKEVFDEDYEPSPEEILEYAKKIGINVDKERHLLYIAREGLIQPLPPEEWRPCFSEQYQAYYYYNTRTQETQWTHPWDPVYKQKVREARATNRRPLLDTSEEVDSGFRSEEMERMEKRLVGGKFLAPLVGRTGAAASSPASTSSNSDLKPLSRVDQIRRQFDVQKVEENTAANSDAGVVVASTSKKPPIKGFTLTGTGSMFLKSNTKKQNVTTDESPTATTIAAITPSPGVKGILRDSSLTDVRSRGNASESGGLGDLSGGEDKKSVRFSLFGDAVEVDSADAPAAALGDSSPKVVPPQRPSSALNKNLHFKSSDDTSSGDDDGEEDEEEEVLEAEDLVNDADEEDAWTPKPPNIVAPVREIKVVPSMAKQNVSLRKTNDEVDIFELELARTTGRNQMDKLLATETSKLQQEIDDELLRIREESARKLYRIIQSEEAALKIQLEERREEIEMTKQRSLTTIEAELEAKVKTLRHEIEESYKVSLDSFRDELRREFDEKRRAISEEHKTAMALVERNHREILQDLERDLKSEEELIRKEHAQKISQMKSHLHHELETERQKMRDTGDDRLYEKIRCEKRLLEDKYRCLKDKYVRLKTDVKLSLEKRNNRRAREQQIINTSETDRSNSNKTMNDGKMEVAGGGNKSLPMDHHSRLPLEKKNSVGEKYLKHVAAHQQQQQHHNDDTTSISQSDTTVSHTHKMNYSAPLGGGVGIARGGGDEQNSDSEAACFVRSSDQQQQRHSSIITQKLNFATNEREAALDQNRSRERKKLFSRMKSASTSRLHSAKNAGDLNGRPCTPVENLRRQLKKLEDLEDQFPENTLEATYHLRYPFSDATATTTNYGNTSSELEFFKHRIHLERDSVRRAKDNLKTQRENFRAKQREIKLHHKAAGRHNVEQVISEEKELTEMEVNLHRTRALLGEKVIRLRHLEQSLQRLFDKDVKKFCVDNKNGTTTLSDLSSHSSSGFSSTDFVLSDTNQLNNNRKPGAHHHETDILKNLELLNSEIKEIWEILSKQGNTTSGHYYTSDLDWSFNANTGPSLPLTPNPLLDTVTSSSPYRPTSLLNRNFTSVVSQSPIAGQYTSTLVERTRDLRNWLRQAKQEHLLAQKHNSNV